VFLERVDRRLTKPSALDHRLLRRWRCDSHAVLVGVSGGLDSVCLLDFLWRWRRRLKIQIAVAHVHHGKIRTRQGAYRDRAALFVHELAQQYGLSFYANFKVSARRVELLSSPEKPLKGEAALRDFRYEQLGQFAGEWESEIGCKVDLGLAHTSDDQLETRVMRLLRGTGPDGLSAMRLQSGGRIRPLLFEPRSELKAEAVMRQLKWLDDPSNRDREPLRNWIRHHWLIALDKRDRSLRENLARSLELITPADDKVTSVSDRLSRSQLFGVSLTERQKVLAQYFRRYGMTDYTMDHVTEVLKRLDTDRSRFTFRLLKRRWVVDKETVQVVQD
jgi:tRNA(Ile)-lysidine synthase